MSNKHLRGFCIAGGVCFFALTILDVMSTIMYRLDDISFIDVLLPIGFLILGIALLMNRKSILFPIGSGLIFVVYGYFTISRIINNDSFDDKIYYLFALLSNIGAVFIAILSLLSYFSVLQGNAEKIKKLYLITPIILFIFTIIRVTSLDLESIAIYLIQDILFNIVSPILQVFAFLGLGMCLQNDFAINAGNSLNPNKN